MEMKRKKTDCFSRGKLSICNSTDLMSDGEFMSSERLKVECECTAKHICIAIADCLYRKQSNRAFVLLSDLTN